MIKKEESGMNFVFEPGKMYSIEEDTFNNRITSKCGAKICDFIVYKDNKLHFVEAKSSAPRDKEELYSYTEEISQKFYDSLLVYIGVLFDRKNTASNNISPQMKNRKYLAGTIKFVLVIKGIPKSGLQDIKNVFEKAMRKFACLFSVEPPIIIMNDEQAKSKGWIG